MKTDSEIAKETRLKPIEVIAAGLGIPHESLIPYGHHIAKVKAGLYNDLKGRPDGKLILITSMSPTPAGEGKTTMTIGLAQSLKLLGQKAAACIRQPSLGPYFGAKGGATGGGYSQVLPPDDIAIQFTGDDYALTTSHNLVSSIIDNHIYHGNTLEIDTERILWKRVSTVNDRALRSVVISSGKAKGERVEEFQISAASEIMAILCLSSDLKELKERAGKIVVAFRRNGTPVFLNDLNITGAVAALMRNAINPNLVQSIEGAPVFIHGGPFGNISLGCNSLISTKLALKLSDYVLTEAGFATELGAEKFFDILCRLGSLRPSTAVIVVTLKALRYHGGSGDYRSKDLNAAVKGLENLKKHIENIKLFGVPAIVAINRYLDDTEDEIEEIKKRIVSLGTQALIAETFENGGRGGLAVAEEVIKSANKEKDFRFLYSEGDSIFDKIHKIAVDVYGAEGVELSNEAKTDLNVMEGLGYGGLPVCMAKTPKSLSDNPLLLGRPEGFTVNVRRIRPAAGAGYLVAECGGILLMPGLPMHPRAELIDADAEGNITGT